MITSFEVGAVFKILDEASPAISRILRQVRELNAAVTKARENLALLGKGSLGAGQAGLLKATEETEGLAAAWANVARNAGVARAAIGSASRTALVGGGAAGGGASVAAAVRGRRLAHGGGTGAHIGGPYVPVPGGSHVSFRGGAAAALGLAGYGAYEAAQMEDAVFQLIYHSGVKPNDANRDMFRRILQNSMGESGYSLHDVAESAKQEIRMFHGTPGNGIDVLPEMLRAATIESRLKGDCPEASMKALIGLAHMLPKYGAEDIKKLAPAFAFLSTANPGSLSSIERAAGYAVPLLRAGLEIDPMQTLLMGTALTRAGATSTKSGTWLREMALRAMPGTSMMSKMAFKKHEEALKELGLVDENHKPTWFTDGKPDLLKMLDIGGANAQKIPLTRRAGLERQLFGAQGGGGFALLADPAVRDQVLSLQKEMNSPEFKNRYGTFTKSYMEGSTVQNARTALAEFNNTMMDVGQHTLPAVNKVINDFKAALEGVRSILPRGAKGSPGATMAARGIEGAGAGALVGFAGGPGGVLGGAVAGGVAGVAAGFMESYNDKFKFGLDKGGSYTSPGKTGKPAVTVTPVPDTNLNIHLDSETLAQSVIKWITKHSQFETGAPASDGSRFFGP